ncbi:hypothetical protein A1OW_07400 [Enterovibrio norvegicus]|nr:hypothetical protein A1OW_07400 [Enterovibrio norvegicus]
MHYSYMFKGKVVLISYCEVRGARCEVRGARCEKSISAKRHKQRAEREKRQKKEKLDVPASLWA